MTIEACFLHVEEALQAPDGIADGIVPRSSRLFNGLLALLVRVLQWSPDEEDRISAAKLLAPLGATARGDEEAMAALTRQAREGAQVEEAQVDEVAAACRAALESIRGVK